MPDRDQRAGRPSAEPGARDDGGHAERRWACERRLRLDRRPSRLLPWVYEVYHAVGRGAGDLLVALSTRAAHCTAAADERWDGGPAGAAAHEGSDERYG